MAAQYVLWGYPELLAEFQNCVVPQLKAADTQLETGESQATQRLAAAHLLSPMVHTF